METNLQAIGSERIHAYQTSGQTMKAWCAEQNLTVHQLKYWLYKAQRKRPASSAMYDLPPGYCPTSIHPHPPIRFTSKSGLRESRFAPVLNRSCFATWSQRYLQYASSVHWHRYVLNCSIITNSLQVLSNPYEYFRMACQCLCPRLFLLCRKIIRQN